MNAKNLSDGKPVSITVSIKNTILWCTNIQRGSGGDPLVCATSVENGDRIGPMGGRIMPTRTNPAM